MSRLTPSGFGHFWNKDLAKRSVLVIEVSEREFGRAIEITTPGISHFWVNSMYPDIVLAWYVADNKELDGLEKVFGFEWADGVRLVLNGENPATYENLAPPKLGCKWVKVIMDMALEQWSPGTFVSSSDTVGGALAV